MSVWASPAKEFIIYDGSNASEILESIGTWMGGFTVDGHDETDGTLVVNWTVDSGSVYSGQTVLNQGDALEANYTAVVPADVWAQQYVIKEQ